jgi:rRNA maturation endonuclease Nob1
LSHLIKLKSPTQLSIDKVKSFARKTGDFASLSETDILLIAIAYTIIE